MLDRVDTRAASDRTGAAAGAVGECFHDQAGGFEPGGGKIGAEAQFRERVEEDRLIYHVVLGQHKSVGLGFTGGTSGNNDG